MMEDPPPHDRGTVTDNSSESTDRSERVPPVILSLLPLSFSLSSRLFLVSSFQLFLSVCPSHSFSFRAKEGRSPLPPANIHNQAVSIEALAALPATLPFVRFQPRRTEKPPRENFRNGGRRHRRRCQHSSSSLTAATIKVTFHFVYSKWTACNICKKKKNAQCNKCQRMTLIYDQLRFVRFPGNFYFYFIWKILGTIISVARG